MSIPSRNVAFNKPKEPSFLKAFKAKVGYKEPATIDSKREVPKPPTDDGSEVEREDEQPTVVVLKGDDISEEEYQQYRERMKQNKEDSEDKDQSGDKKSTDKESSEAEGGRIVFKRPAKRKSSESGVLDASTNKKAKQDSPRSQGGSSGSGRQRRRSSGESQSRGVKNSSLLSFGDEEEDD